MLSQNQQYQIAEELRKIFCFTEPEDFNIVCYELEERYKIAVSSNCGMLPGIYIAKIVKLSQEYNFEFYISNTCVADIDGDLFLIIY